MDTVTPISTQSSVKPSPAEKKLYVTPHLQVHGTVSELTGANGLPDVAGSKL